MSSSQLGAPHADPSPSFEDREVRSAELEAHLGGKTFSYDPDRALLGNISTNELTPGWACYYYDETLARYCLVGLRGGKITRDAIRSGGFGVIASGISKGCGSSRATAPRRGRAVGGVATVHGHVGFH